MSTSRSPYAELVQQGMDNGSPAWGDVRSIAARKRGGFTLLEMLVVVAIMMLIAGIVTPAANSILKASQLTQAGQILVSNLALARQTALSRNLRVEIRFYRFVNPEIPGEGVPAAGKGKYRAFQLFEIHQNGGASPISQVARLPQTIIIDASSDLSSILNQAQRPVAAPTSSAPKLPGVDYAYNYVAFRYHPDGSTDLSEPSAPGKQWFLTLHGLNDGDGRTQPPSNFLTVQINPYNGNLRTFRP